MTESKYGKYILTEDLMPPMPEAMVKAMDDQAKEGKILDRTMLLGIMDSIVPGARCSRAARYCGAFPAASRSTSRYPTPTTSTR